MRDLVPVHEHVRDLRNGAGPDRTAHVDAPAGRRAGAALSADDGPDGRAEHRRSRPRDARLDGELRLPGDKSISHRALMLALLADGESRIRGAGDGADVRSTAGIVEALGATRGARGRRCRERRLRRPLAGARAHPSSPTGPLDCGNSGTSLRLFAGILAGQPIPGDPRRGRVAAAPPDGPDHRAAAGDGRHARGQSPAIRGRR